MHPGAPWLDVPYDEQLRRKEEFLETVFGRAVPLTSHPSPLGYRNRVDLSVEDGRIGFRSDSRTVEDCASLPLASSAIQEVYARLRRFATAHGLPGVSEFHIRSGAGVQVALTADASFDASSLREALAVRSLWVCAPDDQQVFGDQELLIPFAGKSFAVTPETFFQTSPAMAERVVERLCAEARGDVLDLFCGVGTLGIAVSPERLVGVDIVDASIAVARENASRNAVDAEFVAMDAARFLAGKRFETIIVDPPRRGLGPGAVSLLAAAPERILYVSCDPRTQARDLAFLSSRYSVRSLEAFDFFPQTPPVESLAVLEKK